MPCVKFGMVKTCLGARFNYQNEWKACITVQPCYKFLTETQRSQREEEELNDLSGKVIFIPLCELCASVRN